ncbi:MAG: D-TA family PLP-dependent enzyme [Bacteroidota bacterium]
MSEKDWFYVEGIEEIHTPSLLVFPERVEHNIREMIRIAGSPERLRPHVKTYKMAEVIQMQMAHGINKFKCATIAEAELLASVGVEDILLAMQPVGPNIVRFLEIAAHYPKLNFSCLADNPKSVETIATEVQKRNLPLGIFIDINNGMHRTGIAPGSEALMLFQSIAANPYVMAKGFHVYDGHLRIPDFEERKKACAKALHPVLDMKVKLERQGLEVESIIVGGSPTFPAHAHRSDVVLSPGTVLLWDAGYGSKFPEMNFQHAAVLATRLISKPKFNQFCLDLGHKALASEMAFPRVQFLNTQEFDQLGQSEEHFVVSVKNSEKYEIGDVFYAVPMHICPTVAKYPQVITVEDGKASGTWKVAARDHKITF